MPNPIEFKQLNDAELTRELGAAKTFKTDFPKTATTGVLLKSKLKTWQGRQAIAAAPAVKMDKIAATALKAADIEKVRAIHESPTPTAEAIVNQKMGPEKVLGTLFSSITTLEYTKLESEFKTRQAAATTPAAKLKVQNEWNQVLKAGQQAFASGGVANVKESDLKKFSQELVKTKANFNAVVKIANSSKVVTGNQALTAATVATGGWETHTGVFADNTPTVISVPDLCSRPFAEGTYTKSFSRSFNLTVRLRVWCPTWTNPFRTCVKSFTLAGVSFSLSLQVGYRVTCCGATAWGQASARACGTVIGITVCAGCTARITGVAGVGRSTSGSNCVYGVGVNAQLSCTFAGITVFNVQVPFGFNVNGPCPPAGLCR